MKLCLKLMGAPTNKTTGNYCNYCNQSFGLCKNLKLFSGFGHVKIQGGREIPEQHQPEK